MAASSPVARPRAPGVDDFAIRRGQNYGTVIVDRQADALSGRPGGQAAGWLVLPSTASREFIENTY